MVDRRPWATNRCRELAAVDVGDAGGWRQLMGMIDAAIGELLAAGVTGWELALAWRRHSTSVTDYEMRWTEDQAFSEFDEREDWEEITLGDVDAASVRAFLAVEVFAGETATGWSGSELGRLHAGLAAECAAGPAPPMESHDFVASIEIDGQAVVPVTFRVMDRSRPIPAGVNSAVRGEFELTASITARSNGPVFRALMEHHD